MAPLRSKTSRSSPPASRHWTQRDVGGLGRLPANRCGEAVAAFRQMLREDGERAGFTVSEIAWRLGITRREYRELEKGRGGRATRRGTGSAVCTGGRGRSPGPTVTVRVPVLQVVPSVDRSRFPPETTSRSARNGVEAQARRAGRRYRRPVEWLAERLAEVEGVVAVALGGSRAQGTHRPDSDWDFGLYYRGTIDPEAIRALGYPGTVLAPGEWAYPMNGGAWLTVEGEKVDLHYRDLDDV
jgi:hypothetical protein